MSNLLTIDGQPIDVAVVGSTQHALDGGEVQLVPCGPDAKGITLGAGPHVVQTAVGHNPPCASTPTTCTGWNIDQLVLDSARRRRSRSGRVPHHGRHAAAAGHPARPGARPSPRRPSHIDTHGGRRHAARPSPSSSCSARASTRAGRPWPRPGPGAPPGSHAVDLGQSQLVDGFANGWQVTAADLHALGGSSFTVELTWTPQREVWAALAVSAATLLLCLVLGFLPRAGPPLGAGPPAPPPARPGRARAARSGRRRPSTPPSWPCPGAPAPKEQRQRGWLRFPRALLIGAACGGGRPARHPAAGRARRRRRGRRSASSSRGPAPSPAWAGSPAIVAGCHQRRAGPERAPLPVRLQLGGVLRPRGQPHLARASCCCSRTRVISALGLRVPKPLRRRRLRARDRSDEPHRAPPVIVGIDG